MTRQPKQAERVCGRGVLFPRLPPPELYSLPGLVPHLTIPSLSFFFPPISVYNKATLTSPSNIFTPSLQYQLCLLQLPLPSRSKQSRSPCTPRLLPRLRLLFAPLLLSRRPTTPMLTLVPSILDSRVCIMWQISRAAHIARVLSTANDLSASWCNAQFDTCNTLCGNPTQNQCDNVGSVHF